MDINGRYEHLLKILTQLFVLETYRLFRKTEGRLAYFNYWKTFTDAFDDFQK